MVLLRCLHAACADALGRQRTWVCLSRVVLFGPAASHWSGMARCIPGVMLYEVDCLGAWFAKPQAVA